MVNGFTQKAWLSILLAAILLATAACAAPPSATSISAARPEIGTVLANGIKVAYERRGPLDGETVLLIAGTGNQLIDWPIELVEELVRQGYQVVRFDNRDSGLSTKFTEAGYPDWAAIGKAMETGQPAPVPYTLEVMAEDAIGLLDALNIQKAHMVGVSMGGGIAQFIAIQHPDRTLSLTSIMADSGNPALPVVASPERFAELPTPPVDGDADAFIEYQVKLWQVLGSPDYPTDEQTIRELVQQDVQRSYDPAALARQQAVSLVGHFDANNRYANLRNIKAPTVVLQGADDPLVPVEAAHDLAENITGAELIIIPGMGHDLPVQLVQEIADAIMKAARRSAPTKE